MYAKVFCSIFDGSMRGHADLILVFVNMLCHADPEGIVDRHWRAIVDETGLSPARVKAALADLEGPDGQSRSQNDDGRRIRRLDPDREWGWKIINFEKYDGIRSAAERREYMRKYMAERRKEGEELGVESVPGSKSEPIVSTALTSVSAVSPSDSDSDSDIDSDIKSKKATPTKFIKPSPEEVTEYAKSIGYDLDGNEFCDKNDAKGWKVGSTHTPMKDWRAVVRIWKKNESLPRVQSKLSPFTLRNRIEILTKKLNHAEMLNVNRSHLQEIKQLRADIKETEQRILEATKPLLENF